MGDNITIDWSRAGQVPDMANAFATGFENARKMSLQKEADHARQDALANPSDMNALTKFAVYDPDGAKSIMGMLDYQRAGQARQAAGNVISAYGTPGFAQAPAAMPVPAPQAAPQPAMAASGALPPVAPGTSFQNAFAAVGAPQAQSGQAPAAPQAQGAPQGQSPITDPTHPAAQQVGAAALSGQVDPMQAWARLYSLDPVMGDKMVAAIGSMDKLRLDRLNEMNGSLGSAAQTLLGMPQEQRAAAFQQMVPMLQQHGVTPQAMQQALQAGLSDSFLHGVVGQIVGTTGLIEQANKDRDFGLRSTTELGRLAVDQGTLAETSRHNRYEEGKPQIVSSGGALVKPDGTVVYDPLGAPSGGGGPALNQDIVNYASTHYGLGSPQARAIAAVSAGEGGQLSNVNTTGGGHGAFGLFQIRDSGGQKEMLAKYGPNPTMQQQVDFYVQHNIGNLPAFKNAKTEQEAVNVLVNQVQRAGGDGPALLARAQAALNGGGGGRSTLESMASAIARGDQAPFSGRAAASGVGARVMGRVYEINPNYDSKNYTPAVAAIKAFSTGKQGDAVRSLNVAVGHIQSLGVAADALANGNTPMFNQIAQTWAKATGHAAPTTFDALKQIVADEVVKAVVGAGGGVGDREAMQNTVMRQSSPAQLRGVMNGWVHLMQQQAGGLRQQYQQSTGRQDFDRFLSPTTMKAFGGGNHMVANNTPPAVAAVLRKYGINH